MTSVYVLCLESGSERLCHVATKMDGSTSAPACLPVWRADVAFCLLFHSIKNCRCIMPQKNKPGQRWWQRCWTHTLTLQARLTRYVAGLMWGGVCLASACVLLCGSEMCGWEACTLSWIRAALPTFVQTDCLYIPKL